MASKAGGKSEPSDAIRARCLVEADLPGETDVTVAKRHGLSARSISRWRSELDTKPELAAAVAKERAAAAERLDRWSRPLKHAVIQIAGEAVRLSRKAKNAEQLPGIIRSLVGLVQALAHHEIMLARGVGDAARSGQEDDAGAPLVPERETPE